MHLERIIPFPRKKSNIQARRQKKGESYMGDFYVLDPFLEWQV